MPKPLPLHLNSPPHRLEHERCAGYVSATGAVDRAGNGEGSRGVRDQRVADDGADLDLRG